MNKLKGKKVIWIGDINVDQNKINDLDYRKLDSTLKSFNMIQTIQRYTRVARKGNKFTYITIDVIITNCYADFENSSVGDHFTIKCELQFKGAGGALNQNSLEIDFIAVSDRGE